MIKLDLSHLFLTKLSLSVSFSLKLKCALNNTLITRRWPPTHIPNTPPSLLPVRQKHCNDTKQNSRKAQERSDIVFLSIYLKTHPIPSALAVVTSIGIKTFTVFVPSLGLNTKIFLDDHADTYNVTVNEENIILYPKDDVGGSRLDINIFSKIAVSCSCKESAPIDVSLRIVGAWVETRD